MKLHKFLGISSLIIPLIFGILFILNQFVWDQNVIFLYILYGSLILSSILISIGVFLTKKNIFIAFINLVPALFSTFFTIWQIILTNNHYLFHKYYDLTGGGIFSIALQIILIFSSSIYLIITKKESSCDRRIINKETRLFGIIGLIVYLSSLFLVIPAYFLRLLLPWVIVWFVIQALSIGYLSFLLIYKKLYKLSIPIGITIIQYVISLMLMIVCELTKFRYPFPSIIYVIFGLITIVSIAVNLSMLTEYKISKS